METEELKRRHYLAKTLMEDLDVEFSPHAVFG